MKKLTKYTLELEKAYPYWYDHVKCGLSLSARILEKINFFEGRLFTLLPDTANFLKLNSFNTGILPSLGKDTSGKFVNAWKVPTLDEELSEFIYQFLEKDREHAVVFEHALARPHNQSIKDLDAELAIRGNEVYYGMHSGTSKSIIHDAIADTDQVWHFLVVLTHDIDKIGPTLTDEEVNQIINNTSCIIIGAYDGEGYLFWEKN